MIECGMRVGGNSQVSVGDVEVDYTALARAADVDRRVVKQTVQKIERSSELMAIFSKLSPSGSSLVGVASALGYSVLVVGANPKATGVIAEVAKILSDSGIVIRQALAEDQGMVPDAKLTLVVEGEPPGDVLAKLEALDLVESVTLRK